MMLNFFAICLLSYYSFDSVGRLYELACLLCVAAGYGVTEVLEVVHICVDDVEDVVAVVQEDRDPHVRAALRQADGG